MIKKVTVGFLFISSFFVFSCGNNESKIASQNTPQERKDSLLKAIDSAETLIKNNLNKSAISFEIANYAFLNYAAYAQSFPKDTITPYFLFKAADLSMSALKQPANAIVYLDKIVEHHKQFQKYPETLFLRGFCYQEYIKDTAMAAKNYRMLIDKYPNHLYSEQAGLLLGMMGKSDEQIIKEFEKKNK